MADSGNWRNSVTASERYENIQKIQQAAPEQNAFSIENAAYQTSTRKEEYLSAITLASSPQPQQPSPATIQEPSSPPYHPRSPSPSSFSSSSLVKIGTYPSCQFITSGVTSEVYRATQTSNPIIALKVITNTNIEPHNPHREAKILSSLSHPNVISLLSTFIDPSTQNFVLAFPYQPLTLSDLALPLSSSSLTLSLSTQLFSALSYLHSQSIIHRDVKPSSILLSTTSSLSTHTTGLSAPSYQLLLSDFGTAYHPHISLHSEPPSAKCLEVGTGPYRAPETLFGNRSYDTSIDIWAAGCTLSECLTGHTLFTCPPSHEDGNQLGLVLSIFKTLGSPTRETWPEAEGFRTPPFEMYRVFEGKKWDEILEGVDEKWVQVVEGCVRYESSVRLKAGEVLKVLEGLEIGRRE
ncbi:kinase-like domain-containing protein [Cladorrhinum sp. PSN259]|nr:kinase-like domain-containing protein [Cladorrhinum sp. PSN259]